MFCNDFEALKKRLENRHFNVHTATTSAEAKDIALSLIGSGSVGCGGSKTVKDIGLTDALRANGNEVHFHWEEDKARRREVTLAAAASDWFVCSTNAITKDGQLINIDGTGNRVASMLFGPRSVILIIGKNKLAEDYDSAIERIKACACPPNARRQGMTTPCAVVGRCTDCNHEQRMCNVTTIITHMPKSLDSMHLIFVDEELGL